MAALIVAGIEWGALAYAKKPVGFLTAVIVGWPFEDGPIIQAARERCHLPTSRSADKVKFQQRLELGTLKVTIK